MRCPVCGRRLRETQITSINAHIDECLSLPVITSITSSSGSVAHSEGRAAVHERRTAEGPKKSKSDSGIYTGIVDTLGNQAFCPYRKLVLSLEHSML